MPEIILGAVVLFLLLWGASAFSRIDPKQAARLVRALGGVATVGLAAFLGLRGQIGIAILVGGFGLGLLGWRTPFGFPTFGARARKSAGRASQVRTAYLAMELDHDSGRMRGEVLAGAFAGASLDALDRDSLFKLYGEIDRDSRDLLAAYLDRREPGWREHAERDAGAGGDPRAAGSGKMTKQEAYQILGIEPGASAQEIARAHRSLMKKLHPDQGGTTYLAARVNEAKDVLLRRHR
jgi:hypothetical protein